MENLKNNNNFYKVVYFINYQVNLVPRVSHIPTLPVGRKMKDPENEDAIKHHPGNCSLVKLMANDSYLCIQTS